MTEQDRTANAAREIDRAGSCLQEAHVLMRSDFPQGTVARAYYVVFHAAVALLARAGISVSTHTGVSSLLSQHFIRTGRLPDAFSRLLSRMQRDREDADYDSAAVFTAAHAQEAVDNAERFLASAKSLLADWR